MCHNRVARAFHRCSSEIMHCRALWPVRELRIKSSVHTCSWFWVAGEAHTSAKRRCARAQERSFCSHAHALLIGPGAPTARGVHCHPLPPRACRSLATALNTKEQLNGGTFRVTLAWHFRTRQSITPFAEEKCLQNFECFFALLSTRKLWPSSKSSEAHRVPKFNCYR